MGGDFKVRGTNQAAPFNLTVHRGDGMCLLAMDWKDGEPPNDFVGFAIEFRPPGSDRYYAVNNRLCFPGREKSASPDGKASQYPSTEAPFQTFRWVHFPRDADKPTSFFYRVTPMFMGENDAMSRGEAQDVEIELQRETFPGKLDVAFTRGFVSSQAFADKFGGAAGLAQLIPADADDGLEFVSTHPKAAQAYDWMGFDARDRIVNLLRMAINDHAEVRVIAYELNLPEIVSLLEQVGNRLKIIIDDSASKSKKSDGTVVVKDKGAPDSAESKAAARLAASGAQILRQHMSRLQHNKMIVVDGPTVQAVVCGSTNFSWRGFYVQANNAVIILGADAVKMQLEAFADYWDSEAGFRTSKAAVWRALPLAEIVGQIDMSPHSKSKAVLNSIGDDIRMVRSSLFYSLAFLNQTSGAVTDAVGEVTQNQTIFAFGISDKKTGIIVHETDGNTAPVYSSALTGKLPEPFRSESSGGSGVKMHHKFIVLDFDKPSARVYTGSFNFSSPADVSNGENLLLFRDQRIATSYMIEAVRIYDHYRFRVAQSTAKKAGEKLQLLRPPVAGQEAWWKRFYTQPHKIKDRLLFVG